MLDAIDGQCLAGERPEAAASTAKTPRATRTDASALTHPVSHDSSAAIEPPRPLTA